MTQKVTYSNYSRIITLCTLALLVVPFLIQLRRDTVIAAFIGGIIMLLLAGALWYAPVSVSLDGRELSVRRPLRSKKISLADIASVDLCPPTVAERRICGSGGFLGYWGRFYEPSVGRYFAYYGKASDCFLVTLRDGRRYMLGCNNAPTMVEALKKSLKNQSI